MAEQAAAVVVVSEQERVERWVALQMVVLGFNVRQAEALAAAGADHHEAERLIRSGCPFAVAFDLLS